MSRGCVVPKPRRTLSSAALIASRTVGLVKLCRRRRCGSGIGGIRVWRPTAFHRQRRRQELFRRLVAVFAHEPGLVRGVLEQAPDEVGHAGDDGADRDVDAGAVALLDDGVAQLLGHAEEHLKLDVASRGPARCALTTAWAIERGLWVPKAGRRCGPGGEEERRCSARRWRRWPPCPRRRAPASRSGRRRCALPPSTRP